MLRRPRSCDMFHHGGRKASRCLLMVIASGHHLPCPTAPFSETLGSGGGERWVAHTGIAGRRRGGQRRRGSGRGGPDRRGWVVATPARGGCDRGAGISANRSATSRQSSCSRRIHSASTIAAASSSRAVIVWVSVAISLTPFSGCRAPARPPVGWADG